MWLQIVGKFRLANTAWVNHSWHATFYVTGRGLTTSLVPGRDAGYEVVFDFLDHALRVTTTEGAEEQFALEPMPVAAFHERFLAVLARLGAPTRMHHAPNEVPDPVAFREQTAAGAYDPAAAQDFWRALAACDAVFEDFRTSFLGKVSPVHLFWGSLDLAVTRFSGRSAPVHPGGFPALPDAVTREAYSHEVISAGFWPGGGPIDAPAFYCYAYPAPPGLADAAIDPEGAYYAKEAGEFLLPYDVVRTAADPEATLRRFLVSTYDAAANLAGWDRASLDCEPGRRGVPRTVA